MPSPTPTVFVGLDVGGSNIKVMAFSEEGAVLAESAQATLDDGGPKWLERARVTVHEILKRCPGRPTVGVAAPGLPARDRRSIAYMPGRLQGLENLNWKHWLQLDTDVPVLNDAQAALLGETWRGAANGSRNVVLLTLGTGVGGAAIVDGHLLRGHLGRAGHLGHISLNPDGPLDVVNTPGSLEDAIGEHNLKARTTGQFTCTRELVAAVRAGSAEATLVWQNSIRALAAAIAGLINVLDPEILVLGGGIADADELLCSPLREQLDRFEWRPGGARVRIVKAALGAKAGATGAAYAAKLMITANERNLDFLTQ